jgi:hypothetical protein
VPLLVAGCLAVAAVSLLLPSAPTYDPWAWIIWGREIVEGDLVTRGGPSWKPLPMLFTVPFALAGDSAPDLWLVIARAGGLLGIAMAYRLGSRLAGPGAGAVAALAIAVSDGFLRHSARGFSEGLLVGLVLLALDRHLEHRRGQAFALFVAAGLLRPEVWPFVGLYGLWLVWREPGRIPLVGLGFASIGVLWFVPEHIGSGDFMRAATRARDANIDSAAYAAHPWFEVLRRSTHILAVPVMALAVVGVVARRRDHLVVALAGGVAILMAAVAAMTQVGFAGNLRYVALPAGLVCVLAGVGAAAIVRRFGPLAAVALVAATVPFAIPVANRLELDARKVRSEAALYDTAPLVIAKAGGAARVNACGSVFTGRFEVPAIAWYLHRHLQDVGIFPVPPGHTFAQRFAPLARDPRFPRVTSTAKWVVGRVCAPS